MTRYLISFDDGAMTIPDEDLPEVAEAAHKVVDEAEVLKWATKIARACRCALEVRELMPDPQV